MNGSGPIELKPCAVCGTALAQDARDHRYDRLHQMHMVARWLRAAGYAPIHKGGDVATNRLTNEHLRKIAVAAGITPRARKTASRGTAREHWVPTWVVPLLLAGMQSGDRFTSEFANVRARLLHRAVHDRELRAAWTALVATATPAAVQEWMASYHRMHNGDWMQRPGYPFCAHAPSKKPLEQRGFKPGDPVA